jgi:hypothetical protein
MRSIAGGAALVLDVGLETGAGMVCGGTRPLIWRRRFAAPPASRPVAAVR